MRPLVSRRLVVLVCVSVVTLALISPGFAFSLDGTPSETSHTGASQEMELAAKVLTDEELDQISAGEFTNGIHIVPSNTLQTLSNVSKIATPMQLNFGDGIRGRVPPAAPISWDNVNMVLTVGGAGPVY